MGASKDAVRSIVGPPKSSSRDGSLTTWNYGGGAVCVFKDEQLIASNISSANQYTAYMSSGVAVAPAVAVVAAPPVVYTGATYPWWNWGVGCGWGSPWGWGGYWGPAYRYYPGNCRPYYYRGNYGRYYYRGNYYYNNRCGNSHH